MNNKKIFFIKTGSLLTIAMCVFSAFIVTNVSAASAKKNAIKAYKKILSKSVFKTNVEFTPTIKANKLEFAIAYIDNNNIPELMVRRQDRKGFYMEEDILIYTYYNKKVKQLKFLHGNKGIIDGTSVNGGLYMKPRYYKKTGVFCSSGQYGEQYYWKLSKGKVKTKNIWYLHKDFSENGTIEYYDENEHRISKKQFEKYAKSMTKNKKPSYFKFYKNTSNNRKKYIK